MQQNITIHHKPVHFGNNLFVVQLKDDIAPGEPEIHCHDAQEHVRYTYGTDVTYKYNILAKERRSCCCMHGAIVMLHNCTYFQMEVLEVLHSNSCHHEWLGRSRLYSLQAP